MALHILNEQKSPDAADQIVAALNSLVQHKLHKNQLEHKFRFLKSQNLNHEQALHGAHLSEKDFGTLLKGIQNYRTGMPEQVKPRKLSPGEVEEEKLLAHKKVEEQGLKEDASRKIKILDKMEQLIVSGQLSGGTWANLNKYLGTSAVGTTPETEQFAKLSEQLLPATKSQAELRSEQAKVPNVGQSDQAKLAIINDLKQELKARLGENKQSRTAGIPEGYQAVASLGTAEKGDLRKAGNKIEIFDGSKWVTYKG